jgi:hypothetical protein
MYMVKYDVQNFHRDHYLFKFGLLVYIWNNELVIHALLYMTRVQVNVS